MFRRGSKKTPVGTTAQGAEERSKTFVYLLQAQEEGRLQKRIAEGEHHDGTNDWQLAVSEPSNQPTTKRRDQQNE